MAGKLIVISGPSGAGKSTIYKAVLERMPTIEPSISVTTRAPRGTERDGVEYFFVSEQRFKELLDSDGLLEYAKVYDKYYGTPKQHVSDVIGRGGTIMLEIDVQGAEQIKKKFPSCITIFIMPPSLKVLESRLRGRGTDKEEVVLRRLAESKNELKKSLNFDYVVFNEVLETAIDRTEAIIASDKSSETDKVIYNKSKIEKLLNE